MATNTNVTTTTSNGGGNPLAAAWLRFQSLRMGDVGTSARARLRLQKTLGDTGAAIRTSAVGGYVELRGTVATRELSDHAADVARDTRGARGVLNFLDIK